MLFVRNEDKTRAVEAALASRTILQCESRLRPGSVVIDGSFGGLRALGTKALTSAEGSGSAAPP